MTNEIATLKKFKVLGYTTDFGQCECCGKDNLKGTVSILDIDSGVVAHFGTTCAANADKYDTLDAAREAKKEVSKAVRKYTETARAAWGFAYKSLRMEYGNDYESKLSKEQIMARVNDFEVFYTNPENKHKAHPLFAQLRAAIKS